MKQIGRPALFIKQKSLRPYRLAVRTAFFQEADWSSTLHRAAKMANKELKVVFGAILFSVAVSFFIFGSTITHPFLFDDTHLELNRQVYNLGNIGDFFTSPYHFIKSGVYRPLPMISYAINQFLFGSSTVSFRIFQIILYGLGGAVLFFLLRKLRFSFLESALAGLIFLFHPIHSDLVNVVTYRHDILVVIFGLLAILLRLKGRVGAAYVLFFLSLLSKETGVMIMLLMLYYLLFIAEDQELNTKSFFQKLAVIKKDILYFFVTLFIYMIFRFQALQELVFYDPTTIVENQLRHTPFWPGILTAIKVIGLYVVKIFYPKTLSIDHSYRQIATSYSALEPLTALGLFTLLVCMVVILPWVKLNYKYKIAALFFLFPILIVSNIFLKIGAIAGERWLYMPSAAFAILISIFLSKLIHYSARINRKAILLPIVLLALLLGVYYYRDQARNADWKDAFALYESTAAASPNSVLARNNMGAMYLLKKDYPKARAELEEATKIYPDYPQLVFNWGIYFQETGDIKKGEEYFLKTLAVSPEYVDAYSRLIEIYVLRKDYDRAMPLAVKKFEITQKQSDADVINFLIFKKNGGGTGR